MSIMLKSIALRARRLKSKISAEAALNMDEELQKIEENLTEMAAEISQTCQLLMAKLDELEKACAKESQDNKQEAP